MLASGFAGVRGRMAGNVQEAGSRCPVSLRQAGVADAEAIAGVINAAYRVERFFIDRDRTSREEVAELLRKGSFLVAEDGAAGLAGCVYVEVRGERGYFGLLSVDPGRQRHGLGRALVAAAEDQCRRAGCTAMDIQVVDLRTELPPLYRRLGYRESGSAPFEAPTRRPCRFILMSKPLA